MAWVAHFAAAREGAKKSMTSSEQTLTTTMFYRPAS